MSTGIEDVHFTDSEKPDIRLVLFDIDGTLLDKRGQHSASLLPTLQRLRQRGVKTAIASGRPAFGARALSGALALDDMGVFCSGAQILEPRTDHILQTSCIDSAVNLKLLQRLRDAGVYYEMYTDRAICIETQLAPKLQVQHAGFLNTEPLYGNLDELVDGGHTIKWVAGVDHIDKVHLLAALEAEFPGLCFAYARFPPFPTWRFVNIVSEKANKKRAFERLLAYYRLQPHQVASFGDSHSDLEFIRLAGWGVAMGDASEDVKQAARFVTRTVDEDGVVVALMRLI